MNATSYRLSLGLAVLLGACGGSDSQGTTTPAVQPQAYEVQPAAPAPEEGLATIIEATHDPKTNFDGYKSYAWAPSMAALEDPDGKWIPVGFDMDSEIRFLIDQELRSKGMSFADAKPDAVITYALVIDMDVQAEVLQKIYGSRADLSKLQEGALLIGLIDPNTKGIVWAGAARGQVREKSTAELAKARLSKVVKGIFEFYGKSGSTEQ